MSDAQVIRFGRYRLDPVQGLTRGKRELRLTPKSLAVLSVLVERPGQIVAKEDIFRTVWPDTAVTDSTLTSCIQELRHAFGDDARRPRFLETVHRRGYRFVAHIDAVSGDCSPLIAPPFASDQASPIVGREAALEQMRAAYALAERGARQVLFIAGEPGIGKTTLVSTFVAEVGRRQHVRTAMGQCFQHYGAGEPYQPLLEALTRLCRQSARVEWIDALQQYAPSWLPQLPPEASSRVPLRRTATGTTPTRMLRELNDAIEAATQRAPLLLCLEDLHWSDPSTLDWLAAFAQRPEQARVLFVGTFRPSEVESNHPLGEVADRLRVKVLCRDIALAGLDERAIVEYVTRRYPCERGSADQQHLARLVHQRTGGNPLFVVNVLSDLVGRGVLIEGGDTWTVRGGLQASDLEISHDISRIIEGQIERVPSVGQHLLEVASVAGPTFSSAAVAAGAHLPLGDVEQTLVSLARTQRFLRETGAIEWPDGTVATGFEFLHALYRDVLYQRLPAGRRAELHRQIGIRQESAFGERSSEMAAELAMHFEAGRDAQRATVYLQQAAESARGRSAYREARLQYERALELLERQPAGHQRTERELTLRIGLGSVLVAARGWGAPEVEDAYLRAGDLCRELGEHPRLFPALWGLWLFYWGRGPLSTAHELSERLLVSATSADDHALRLQAHHASWATAFSRGEFEAALFHAAAGLIVYKGDRDAAMAATYGGHDAGACGRSFTARALGLIGRTSDAVQRSHEANAHAQALAHPFSVAIAEIFAAAVDQVRRDPASTREHATTAERIAREHEFPLILAWAAVYLGWVAVEEGRREEGLQQIRQGVNDALATGSTQFVTSYLALLAEAHLLGAESEAGLQTIDEALGIVERTGERFYEAELHRLRGELLLVADPALRAPQADGAFKRALDISQTQGAKLLTVRVAISRGRLWCRLGRRDEARQILRASCDDLAENLNGADQLEAQALLND